MWNFLLLVNMPKGWSGVRGVFLPRNFVLLYIVNLPSNNYHNYLLTGPLFPLWPIISPPHCGQDNSFSKMQFYLVSLMLKIHQELSIIHRMNFKLFSLQSQVLYDVILVYFSSLFILARFSLLSISLSLLSLKGLLKCHLICESFSKHPTHSPVELTWTKNKLQMCLSLYTPLNTTEPPVLSFVSTLKLDIHLKISYMYFYKIFNWIEHSKFSERPQFSLRD